MPTPVPVATIIVCAPCLLLSLALIKHKMALGGFDDNELAISPQPPPKKKKNPPPHPTDPTSSEVSVGICCGRFDTEGGNTTGKEGGGIPME